MGPSALSTEYGPVLLRLARETARRWLGEKSDEAEGKPVVPGRFGGVFVTFWHGRTLRGCVGTFAPTTDLARTVAEVTVASLKDGRFAANPITAGELAALKIEISILSDAVPTDDPLSLVPGRHGVIVRMGARTGCFLPHVAVERGWSAEAFLANCCTMKAGLDADAWRSPDVEVLLFEAEVVAEGSEVDAP
ncbi:MAG: AmmeMemoRadiSam system protein A [Phycisphaerae bacterium]